MILEAESGVRGQGIIWVELRGFAPTGIVE